MDLKNFKSSNSLPVFEEYVAALEAFDQIPQLQELKGLAKSRGGIAPGKAALDVGCGFGLETLRLADAVLPSGQMSGLDVNEDFLAEAARRAERLNLTIEFQKGDARALPFEKASFDCVRAERLLIYLDDFEQALAEMYRVLCPGGRLALIEPDFSTNTISFPDRDLLNRILEQEMTHAVVQPSLPGPLFSCLKRLGFDNIEISTRVLIFPQDLAASYFQGLGDRAEAAQVISSTERERWCQAIDSQHQTNEIFATIGYFLFTARRP